MEEEEEETIGSSFPTNPTFLPSFKGEGRREGRGEGRVEGKKELERDWQSQLRLEEEEEISALTTIFGFQKKKKVGERGLTFFLGRGGAQIWKSPPSFFLLPLGRSWQDFIPFSRLAKAEKEEEEEKKSSSFT